MSSKKITPEDAGRALGISAQAVRVQMQKGLLDIGTVIQSEKGKYSYYISARKIYELTGVKFNGYEPVPEIHIDEERLAVNLAKALLPYLTKGA